MSSSQGRHSPHLPRVGELLLLIKGRLGKYRGRRKEGCPVLVLGLAAESKRRGQQPEHSRRAHPQCCPQLGLGAVTGGGESTIAPDLVVGGYLQVCGYLPVPLRLCFALRCTCLLPV